MTIMILAVIALVLVIASLSVGLVKEILKIKALQAKMKAEEARREASRAWIKAHEAMWSEGSKNPQWVEK